MHNHIKHLSIEITNKPIGLGTYKYLPYGSEVTCSKIDVMRIIQTRLAELLNWTLLVLYQPT